ncbi:hypothetical protein [Ralstonia sp. 25mfcol4.1]|uniref:hypothetical protein n=1 Tax=Ralstonia sp. 25mfcol4.1 TaxID=1761899 RepID=UPI001113BDB4|nr:hypothetical protein [Ralstonia sp. 25mfcol4.1]
MSAQRKRGPLLDQAPSGQWKANAMTKRRPSVATILVSLACSGLLGACATDNARSRNGANAATSPERSASGIAYGKPAIGNARGSQVYFLTKTAGGWITTTTGDLRDPATERVIYDPLTKTVALYFEKHPRSGKTDYLELCVVSGAGKETDRSGGYTFCSTGFRRSADTDAGVAAARATMGVLTLGLSEVVDSEKSFTKTDTEAVTAAVAAANLPGFVALGEFRAEYASARDKPSLQRFISRNQGAPDPENLIGKAKARIADIDALTAEFDAATARVSPLSSYKAKFMPAKPEKYCQPFKKDSDEFEICQARAKSIVATLAEPKARVARRRDVCTAVASKYLRDAVPRCNAYATRGDCSASMPSDPNGKRVCSLLSVQGAL